MNETPAQQWPELPLDEWQETLQTLHLWTQIVGKVKVRYAAPQNHWWHVTLLVSSRGLTTGPIPYEKITFQVDFDFIDHELVITTSDGRDARLALESKSVAVFYQEFLALVEGLEIDISINPIPSELPDPIPFPDDTIHASYDPEYAYRCFLILSSTDCVFRAFQADYLGKRSPVGFFWGAFDLAVTRFSGRLAPQHPGGVPGLPDHVVREAYSHEVSSAGWWPGDARFPEPAYFSYTYPEPQGFSSAAIEPAGAFYSDTLYEWVLPYSVVRQSADPEGTLLAFLRTTYAAGATLGNWDREALER